VSYGQYRDHHRDHHKNCCILLKAKETVVAGTTENNNSYSLSVNQVVMKDKLTMQLWGTNTAITTTDKSEDSTEVVGNIELTYVWKKDISVTVGTSTSSFADEMDPASNTHETGANCRLNYSF